MVPGFHGVYVMSRNNVTLMWCSGCKTEFEFKDDARGNCPECGALLEDVTNGGGA